MGITSYLDHHHRLPAPDTPPEALTPTSAISYSSRQFDHHSWKPPAPVSPPMSNYEPTSRTSGSDMSLGKGPDEPQPRREAAAGPSAAPRTQLPSLMSLFGPPTARPIHSPHSDLGPYQSTSPLDRPRGSPTGLDRPYTSSSYFPPPTSASAALAQPRSTLGPGLEERQHFRSLSRAFPGPLSPSQSQMDHQRPPSHSDSSSASKWLTHDEEYRLGRGEPNPMSYRSTSERQPVPVAGSGREDISGVVSPHDGLTPQTSMHHMPGTPASTVTSEGVPVKDGLGPKIWTGTHFLPRFLRAQEVPGEGLCYFYDDGTHCKTVIDGEAVNAHWGVTKAGKPRKRLAIACVTCREKKIKCDPDYPRCVQCEKFGRVCNPRGGHNTSPSTPPAEIDDSRRLGSLIRPPPEHMRPSTHHSNESASPRATLHRPASPEPLSTVPLKRIRVGYDHFTPITGPRSPMAPTPDTARSTMSWHQPELPRIHEDALCRAWQTDPYVSDPQSVLSTISSYFVHTDAASLRFLPERAFKAWVQNSAHRKSPEDQMLVYSILALGILLSGGPKTIAHEYSQVARYATEHAANSIQLVQSRVALCLYYLAIARPSDANDMCSAAISTAICLQLNLELDRSQDAGLTNFPYGLTRAGYAECRRRTFWSLFILERLNGLFPTRVGILNTEDVFVRLPTDLLSFEDQREEMTPEFEPNFSSIQQQRRGVGIMGYVVEVTAIWGEIMTSIYRVANRAPHYGFDFAKFHRLTMARLQDWKSSLPSRFVFSPSTLDAIPREEQGSLIVMHLVYHLAIIKLHRHVPPRFVTATIRNQYAAVAQDHARGLLDVLCVVAKESTMGRSTMPPPFASFTILEAIDVLSAEGPIRDLPALVDGLALARSILEIISTMWEDGKVHKMAMDHRLDKLASLRDRSSAGGPIDTSIPILGLRVFTAGSLEGNNRAEKLPTGVQCWQISDALETRFPREMDCVYTSLTAL
ncbi:hypothetical protein QBC37DRAFT_273346 [Rhypophila decipiens]|uniref:Zn(2)-C6 fungal-type domain-containing protein n=1 Tax=Rhypophila decipiens TaxID=261697 RepID=A0AAN7BFD6_9PEZI|nr:hypothetical protein QBC37DRAFT_273346 [Rhypophila decipiens]